MSDQRHFALVDFPPLLDQPFDTAWPLGAAAQYIVLKHFRELLSHRESVLLGEDVEAVHQIRVAARRTRTALQTLRKLWDSDEVQRFERYLVRFATAFNVARDLDVLVLYFNERIGAAPSGDERLHAYSWLLERNQGLRADEQSHLQQALAKMEESAFPALFVAFFSRRPFDLWAMPGVGDGQS
jgi:CHAD domain-containing protein